jgi:ABC-2 type transport system ATP-binding protein
MTTIDFLSFICDIRKINKKLELSKVIDLLNLKDVLFQKIDTLSKGYKRRVGLAQALIHDPKILILDEPTDGLDPNQKHEVRKLIKKLGKDKSIIISTHILEEVKAICNRTMILSNGKLLIDDTPNNVLKKSEDYNNILVAIEEKNAIDLKKELLALNKFKNVNNIGSLCSLNLYKPSDHTFVSGFLSKKKYTIKHYSVNKGSLEKVFRELTDTN